MTIDNGLSVSPGSSRKGQKMKAAPIRLSNCHMSVWQRYGSYYLINLSLLGLEHENGGGGVARRNRVDGAQYGARVVHVEIGKPGLEIIFKVAVLVLSTMSSPALKSMARLREAGQSRHIGSHPTCLIIFL